MTGETDRDFEFEPLPGLPAPLPEGERLIWRGAPAPWRLAMRACRLPLVGAYFAALAAWQVAGGLNRGATLAELGSTLSFTATLAAISIALLAALGYAIARNAIYTVTSRRVIIRHGVAMPMAINVPFAKIDGAGLRTWADGTGDITLRLADGARIPYLLLWPHARPLRMWPAEPMLRAVPGSARVAALVSDALAAANAADIAMAAGPPAAIEAPAAEPVRRPAARRPRPALAAQPDPLPANTVAAS